MNATLGERTASGRQVNQIKAFNNNGTRRQERLVPRGEKP